ncbi:MAG TPA: decaprenylphospho-beta-D-erythro-pentofuranosid-2-ulose 2-reductase [Actinomycetota bacterium]|nr:decaprenylphospho-beta-D-erythro-pentofuranosid-2-ulose 2-reductase [Actinomycetota bacterium]
MKDGSGSVQTALILGGASDIGLATARRLVRDRTRTVVLAARKPERLAEEADRLRTLGASRVELLPFEALELESHERVIDDAFSLTGDLDVAVLSFGLLGDQRVAERDAAAAVEIVRTNQLASTSLLIPLAERMRGQGHGTIAVLSSVAGERGRRSNFVYGSSKAGLDVFCQGLGDALHGSGVHLLVLRPGFVRSKMTQGIPPAPLSVDPEDVAAALVRGVRSGAEVVWVPWMLRWVMSGLRHLPRPIFRRLEI